MSHTLLPGVPGPSSEDPFPGEPGQEASAVAPNAEDYLAEVLVREGLITREELDEILRIQTAGPYQPLAKLLVDRGVVTARQLKHLLGQRPQYRLGELLIKSGAITPKQLDHALEQQKQLKMPLGQILIKLRYLTDEQIRRALSVQLNIAYVELDDLPIDKSLTRFINGSYARRHVVLPVMLIDQTLTVVMDDPTQGHVVEELTRSTGRIIRLVTAPHAAIQRAFKRLYGSQVEAPPAAGKEAMEILTEEITSVGQPLTPGNEQRGDELFRQVLKSAIELRASDLHLETLPSGLYIRFRMDGVLCEPDLGLVREACDRNAREIVSRIKILGGLDIAERRRPQDGSFRVQIERDGAVCPIDLRISIVPSYYGESVVLRVLDRARIPTSIDQLGLLPQVAEQLKQLAHRPTGILLVTGPTGSGKSTTMYATLLTIHKPQIRILTAEDPVEYVFEQFSQSQVSDLVGNTFATYLRAFLRHDPEVMMIGEIRDRETAEMAFRAAQTGHMLLSTLHTNTAFGVLPRLFDLSIDPGLIASSLNGVLNQRLVRQVCGHCKDQYQPAAEILQEFFTGTPPPTMTWWKGRGCARCGFTGYAGRMTIAELWMPSQHDRILITKRAHLADIKSSADHSTTGMEEDAKAKLLEGRTNLEELLRVLPYDAIYRLRQSWSPGATAHSWS
jgi:type IV pilus assembly protein PilB